MIKTLIFDLDGTIYQDTEFYRDYLGFLVEGTDKVSWLEKLVPYTGEIFTGLHLEMNTFYSPEPIAAGSPEEYFPLLEAAQVKDETAVYLGDMWSVVTLIGDTLGLLENGRNDVIYRRMREKMRKDGVSGNADLKDALCRASEKFTVVLLTNSYESTAMDFLKSMNFEHVFPYIVCSAHKPFGMIQALNQFDKELLKDPASVLTVGDHYYNDLMELQKLGCKTVWVNPFVGIHEPPYDFQVRTMEELAEFLLKLIDDAPDFTSYNVGTVPH